MTSTVSLQHHHAPATGRTPRAAWTGIAFPLLFLASVVVSNPPADDAPDATWIANYASQSEQFRHLATGLLLVLSGLCLASFFSALWWRNRDANPAISPLPLVAASVAAAGIGVGGVVMAFVSGGELFGKYPLPGPDILRLSNDLGFALVSVVGMLSAALAVALLSVQGRATGLLGTKTYRFGIIVAVALIFALAFIPVLALLLWTATLATQWLRAAPATVQ